MRLVAFGDIHMSLGDFRAIPGVKEADYLIVTGDITNYGGQDEAKIILNELMSVNKNILAVFGNLDEKTVGQYLSGLKINLHGFGKLINKVGIFGVGGSNLTPFKTPNELAELEIEATILSGFKEVESAPLKILVSHPPPYDCQVDKINNGVHVGSTAVREFIEKYQPDLCLTGHIHEAVGEDTIGRTLVINPGMLKKGGYIEVLIENGKLTATRLNI